MVARHERQRRRDYFVTILPSVLALEEFEREMQAH
jgi:hypothetical protein